MAYQLGDPTAKYEGRLTLNPIVHFEPVGFICLVATFWMSHGSVLMGWAKPVPINPEHFKSPRLDRALVAAAGPFVNFFCAFLCSMPLLTGVAASVHPFLVILLQYLIVANVGFGLFNLIPCPPLDGWKITGAIVPESVSDQMDSLENKAGLYALVGLLVGLYIAGPYTLYPLNRAVIAIFTGG